MLHVNGDGMRRYKTCSRSIAELVYVTHFLLSWVCGSYDIPNYSYWGLQLEGTAMREMGDDSKFDDTNELL